MDSQCFVKTRPQPFFLWLLIRRQFATITA